MGNDGKFLSLPVEIIDKIFQYLSYDNVSKIREVCMQFNLIAGTCLTQGFIKVQTEHANCLRKVKEELPRRESERRKHKLYPKHDALQGLDTRLSLLRMTYSKYISTELICFIPGKVLDELYIVLRTLKQDLPIPSVNTLLQEVRDVSSMAMEHFDEVITPGFEVDEPSNCSVFSCMNSSSLRLDGLDFSSRVNQRSRKTTKRDLLPLIYKQQKVHKNTENKVKRLKSVVLKQSTKIKRLEQVVHQQSNIIHEIQSQLQEMNTQIHALTSRDVMTPTCSIMSTSSDPGRHDNCVSYEKPNHNENNDSMKSNRIIADIPVEGCLADTASSRKIHLNSITYSGSLPPLAKRART